MGEVNGLKPGDEIDVDGQPAAQALKDIEYIRVSKEMLDDPDFTNCVDIALSLIVNPDAATIRTSALIVKLEAYALVFRLGFAAHMNIAEVKDNRKKNMYKELYQGLDNLSNSLKYMVKNWNDFQ
jgi:hypothetical protein